MNRSFNNRSLELLAPAGTFEIYKGVIDSSCDAVYLGGQNLNMRMIRKGYNLTNQELKDAVAMARDRDKKLYITLNSLLDPDEILEAEEYLDFLQELSPHGLIIQDAAVLELVTRKKIDVPLHASVMMNVHNLDMISFLEKQGISRVILSREMPLTSIRDLSGRTKVELEYFTHGDMCVTHGSQCLYSSYLFGMSSNRGRCLKPCRWPFSQPGGPDEPFPLAVKDLNLHPYLREMILAGISSFKIEGRMREKEFIIDLVNRYGEALDQIIDEPLSSNRPEEDELDPFKKRDFSTGYAFGRPGLKNINQRGEGSGQFYSTGKMFSEPTEELEVPVKSSMPEQASVQAAPKLKEVVDLALVIGAESAAQAEFALKFNPRRIVLSSEPFFPGRPPKLEEISKLYDLCVSQGCGLYLALPKMMSDGQNDLFREFFAKGPKLDGVYISHSGAFNYLDPKSFDLIGDHGLNLYNPEAVKFFSRFGMTGWTASLELPWDSLLAIAADAPGEGEVLIHGRPTVMYMDHDVSAKGKAVTKLETVEGSYPVLRDCWDRYHLLPQKELTLLPRIAELAAAGYSSFRVDLRGYTEGESEALLMACTEVIKTPEIGDELLAQLTPIGGGFTHGAHQF